MYKKAFIAHYLKKKKLKKIKIPFQYFYASDSFVMLKNLNYKIKRQSLIFENAVTSTLKIKSIKNHKEYEQTTKLVTVKRFKQHICSTSFKFVLYAWNNT